MNHIAMRLCCMAAAFLPCRLARPAIDFAADKLLGKAYTNEPYRDTRGEWRT